MSKTTNLLVALGVVAGLGVAALPLSAMATTNQGVTFFDGEGTDTATVKYDGDEDGTVKDTVLVRTEIKDSLSMTVTGANDDKEEKEEVSHLVLLGDDGVITNGGTGEGSTTVKVATNHVNGYKVSIKGTNGGLKGKNTSKLIPNLASTETAIPTSGNTSAYGFLAKVPTSITTNQTGFKLTEDTNWQGVPTTETEIAKSTEATTDAGDQFEINFKVYANSSQAADIYEDTVTITATTDFEAEEGNV